MSIKHSLLALLSDGEGYGYQLRSRFEAITGSTFALNIGQVYSTLSRLERDGLVAAVESGGVDRTAYRITDTGRSELASWWESPVAQADRPRDELAMKIALAVSVPGVDVGAVVQRQRTETMRQLQDFTRLKRQSPAGDLAWRLVLDSMIFAAEAQVRWLDHCEADVRRWQRRPPAGPTAAAPATDPADAGARP